MKRVIGILLLSLLCFSGCGEDIGGTSAVTGQALPVAPFGITDTMTPTYEWTPVPGATRYQLLVEDIGETLIIEQWYTAEEVESASEDGLCSVTPDIIVWGDTWKILACAGEKCGLWSDELQFSYDLQSPTPPRFTDNGDDTVTDNNTNLTWSKNGNLCGMKNWQDAIRYCVDLRLGGHTDWYLPTLPELKSLIDRRRRYPALPSGHPFSNVQSDYYWTSTTIQATHPNAAWYVNMNHGIVYNPNTDHSFYVWPVRSDS